MHAHANQTTTRPVRRPSERPGTDHHTVPMPRKRLWVAVPVALGTLALATACSPSYGGGTSSAASSASVPARAGAAAVVSTASTSVGTVLVGRTGLTLYDFANDTGGRSTCNGACADTWRPVAAPDPLPASLPGVPAALGSTMRNDGSTQLTISGHPVYTFQGDSGPGQTNGNGLTLNGGLWTAISRDGTSVAAGSSSTTTGY
jgi:predicted lipoprotein with Yx(FWY)xxD motif